ncbi:MAG: helix-turn-helix domain-containing protein [Mollicutes bacterium]|nr:helix-turn-helix domain-containing protein [Mollicutes bacterium]
MEEKVNSTLQKQFDALSEEQKEQLLQALKPLAEIKAPEINVPVLLKDVISELSETKKGIAKVLSSINLSSIIDNISKPKRGTELYHGVEIEKYRKIRKIKASELSSLLGVNKATLSKYSSGQIDIPTSKAVELSEILNVSLDLLLRRKKRELKLGYIGREARLYDFDYKKKTYVPTSITYALDRNLKEIVDELIIIRYKKPIYELGLPKDTILFITEGSHAISLGTTKRAAVCIQEKVGDSTIEYFSYVEPLKGKDSDRDYSSAINYTYTKDGETFTCRLSKLQQMVKFVIHKAVIDF